MWEPIPQSSWGLSLSNLLGEKKWDKVRKACYKRAEYECQVCGKVGCTLYAHEEWEFSERPRRQVLVGILCICKFCNDCKHWGRSTQVYGKKYQKELLEHMIEVNKCKPKEVMDELERLKKLNYKRVDKTYKVMVKGKELFLV